MTDWTPERVAELTRLWAEHSLTAEQIARQMGLPSRHAVIGKVHRLGLPGRLVQVAHHEYWQPGGKRASPKPSVASHSPKPPKVAPMPQPKTTPAPEATTTPVRLVDAGPNICRFPMWQERGWPDLPICGAPGYPWCSKHRRVVYQLTVKRSA